MDSKNSYPGHDEGSDDPPNKPEGYSSPATHAPLSDSPTSVNVKTGHPGSGESGS